ncbi:hypothetical protein, partial [Sedimentitalea arenosa]|uniref:hypothetical protein n=1 Tax=Sedimentitalea arenosa TaxID=2798803 RepID=UPI001E3F6EFA
IEMFYNPKRKHANNGMLSPVDFEIRQQKPNQARVKETRGTLLFFMEVSSSHSRDHNWKIPAWDGPGIGQ